MYNISKVMMGKKIAECFQRVVGWWETAGKANNNSSLNCRLKFFRVGIGRVLPL